MSEITFSKEKLRDRIRELESENNELHRRLSSVTEGLKTLVRKLPMAVLITDNTGMIRYTNDLFCSWLDALPGMDKRQEIEGKPLSEVVSGEIADLYMNAFFREDIKDALVRVNGHRTLLCIHYVRRKDMVIGIFSDLESLDVANRETVRIIKESIDRQMSMVQKIGFLLGEEISGIAGDLNSVIRIIEEKHG